jgi:hypothetical protein
MERDGRAWQYVANISQEFATFFRVLWDAKNA